MTNKKWRLSEKPSTENLKQLVEAGILTKEEAKEIILSEDKAVSVPESELKDIKDELALVRELITKLNRPTQVVREYIELYPTPRPWVQPYIYWCSTDCDTMITASGSGGVTNATYAIGSTGTNTIS